MADVISLEDRVPAKKLLGELNDSLGMMRCGVDTLDQLAALFRVISESIEGKSDDSGSVNRDHIRSSVQMGKFVAEDMANSRGNARESTMDSLGIQS